MKAQGNSNPDTCASNLLNIIRGEVPFDRVKGRDGSLDFKPNATDEVNADSEWVLATYEPRLTVGDIQTIIEDESTGDYSILATIARKEDEE